MRITDNILIGFRMMTTQMKDNGQCNKINVHDHMKKLGTSKR